MTRRAGTLVTLPGLDGVWAIVRPHWNRSRRLSFYRVRPVTPNVGPTMLVRPAELRVVDARLCIMRNRYAVLEGNIPRYVRGNVGYLVNTISGRVHMLGCSRVESSTGVDATTVPWEQVYRKPCHRACKTCLKGVLPPVVWFPDGLR